MKYYYFSNGKELWELTKQGLYGELEEAFGNTKLSKTGDVNVSPKYLYDIICDHLYQRHLSNVIKAISPRAIALFVEARDIDALKMVKKNQHMYGHLTQEAKTFVQRYEMCCEKVDQILTKRTLPDGRLLPFEEETDGIKVIYKDGCVKFVDDGREYLRYYPEEG